VPSVAVRVRPPESLGRMMFMDGGPSTGSVTGPSRPAPRAGHARAVPVSGDLARAGQAGRVFAPRFLTSCVGVNTPDLCMFGPADLLLLSHLAPLISAPVAQKKNILFLLRYYSAWRSHVSRPCSSFMKTSILRM
jgi:hypothetical protein